MSHACLPTEWVVALGAVMDLVLDVIDAERNQAAAPSAYSADVNPKAGQIRAWAVYLFDDSVSKMTAHWAADLARVVLTLEVLQGVVVVLGLLHGELLWRDLCLDVLDLLRGHLLHLDLAWLLHVLTWLLLVLNWLLHFYLDMFIKFIDTF